MIIFIVFTFIVTSYFYFFSHKLKPTTVAMFRFISIFVAGISFFNVLAQIEEFGGMISNFHFGNWVLWLILGIFVVRTFIVIKKYSIAKTTESSVVMSNAANVMMVPIFLVIASICFLMVMFGLLMSGIIRL